MNKTQVLSFATQAVFMGGGIAILLWQGAIFIYQMNSTPSIEKAYYNLTNRVETKSNDINLQDVSQLFNHKKDVIIAPIVDKTPEKKPVNFPKTQLQGVVINSNPHKSLAIITLEGKQKILGIGEVIGKSKATINQIMDESIVIQLEGQKKTIAIIAKYGKNVSSNSTPRRNKPRTQPQTMANIRKQLSENPSTLSQYVGFNPEFKKGKVTSYRISPRKNKEVFHELGLKQDDLVYAISSANFRAEISNSSALLSLWQKMKNSDSITLHLTRDGQRHEVVIPLR